MTHPFSFSSSKNSTVAPEGRFHRDSGLPVPFLSHFRTVAPLLASMVPGEKCSHVKTRSSHMQCVVFLWLL